MAEGGCTVRAEGPVTCRLARFGRAPRHPKPEEPGQRLVQGSGPDYDSELQANRVFSVTSWTFHLSTLPFCPAAHEPLIA